MTLDFLKTFLDQNFFSRKIIISLIGVLLLFILLHFGTNIFNDLFSSYLGYKININQFYSFFLLLSCIYYILALLSFFIYLFSDSDDLLYHENLNLELENKKLTSENKKLLSIINDPNNKNIFPKNNNYDKFTK